MTIRLVFRFSWTAVAFVGFCPAVLSCLYFSQTGVIAAALMIGGVGLLHRSPILAGIAVCVVWVFAVRANRNLKAATLLSASVLVPPYLHVYDAAVVTMAAVLLLFEVLKDGGRPGERSAILFAWFLPILVVFTNAVELPVAPVLMFAPFLFIFLRALREKRL